MSKPYFCYQKLDNDKICGKSDPSDFEINRKSICKDCRKSLNRNYSKIKMQKIREIHKEEVKEENDKKEEGKTSKLKSELELDLELRISDLIYDFVINKGIYQDSIGVKRITLSDKIVNIETLMDDLIVVDFVNLNEKISVLENENKELKSRLDNFESEFIKFKNEYKK